MQSQGSRCKLYSSHVFLTFTHQATGCIGKSYSAPSSLLRLSLLLRRAAGEASLSGSIRKGAASARSHGLPRPCVDPMCFVQDCIKATPTHTNTTNMLFCGVHVLWCLRVRDLFALPIIRIKGYPGKAPSRSISIASRPLWPMDNQPSLRCSLGTSILFVPQYSHASRSASGHWRTSAGRTATAPMPTIFSSCAGGTCYAMSGSPEKLSLPLAGPCGFFAYV